MSAASAQDSQRAELEAVLGSGIFDRAPNLANFLKYVCEQHFDGESDSIKEYSIAVEALKRQANFDPKKDSIVRVEAHRLRRRLAEYYAGSGAAHPIQIEIPNGQYSPRFAARFRLPDEGAQGGASEPMQTARREPPFSVEMPEKSRKGDSLPRTLSFLLGNPRKTGEQKLAGSFTVWRHTAVPFALLLVTALALFTIVVTRVHHATSPTPEIWRGSYAEPVPSDFRFLAGYHGPAYTDRQGRVWQSDAYFVGGVSVPVPDGWRIDGLPDSTFAKSRREGSTFRYAIPARQGTYEVHLHFVGVREGDSSDPSSLPLFRVSVNDKAVLDNFDPISEAGTFDRLHSRVIRDVSPTKDGKIHLTFQQITNKAFVSAVEVLSSAPGRVHPVRIVAAKSSVVDSDGSVWVADEDAVGGVLVERKDSIQDARLRMLYAGEHYGNFAYHIPMPPGRYRVKLYFAETYFGSKLPYANGVTGARLFNVFANGVALLREFDVAKEAGGPNRATVRTFENIEPNAQGNIVLEFIPLRNYAEVNAIEVAQMDRNEPLVEREGN